MKKRYFKFITSFVLFLFLGRAYAQTLTNITPSIGMEGSTISVAISGQNSNFLQGTTTVWFNQGSSTLFANNVNVSNATSLIAELGIPYGTPLGLYQTNVQDPVDNTISLANSFTVVANPNSPIIVNVNPSSTMEGTALTVAISGQNTNFQQGTTTVWFNQGSSTIYASSVNVGSNTNLDAFFNIPFGTPLGLYGTNVLDPIDNIVTLPNSFTITANPNAPELVSVTPNIGDLGTTIPVTISGQNTNFLQGTGTLVFVQGSSTLFTSNITYNTNTELGATLTIPNYAYPGYYDVYFTNPLDGTMLLVNGFYVNPPPCGNITVDILQQPCIGGPAAININGGFAPYTFIIDGQSIITGSNYLDYYPAAIGDYTITSVVDNFGCSATAIDSVIYNDEFSASFTASSACVGADVAFTNNIVSSTPITNVLYYYGDGFASSSFTHSYNYPGYYTASMQVTNSNGCSILVDVNSSVQIFPPPQDSIISLTNANCGTNNGSFEVIGVGNGPFNYNVSGVGGYTSNTALNSNLNAGLYSITIADVNACSSSNQLSIVNVSNLTNITGNIQTATATNASNITVNLFSLIDTVGAMALSYTTLTDANGNYSFANLIEGNYILQAKPDSVLSPNEIVTYSNGAYVWYDADTIQVNCTSQQVVDLSLLSAVQQNGTAFVGGFVADYFFSMLSDVDVVLYDDNANQSVARTSTDASGNYSFNNVNAGHYAVYLDIPGLIHNSNYSFNLNNNDNLWDKSYFVDFNTRTMDTVFFFVGTHEINSIETTVYPNPFNSQTTISYNLPKAANINIEVFNYLGQKVETLVNENKTAGIHYALFNTADKAKGVYFIKVTSGSAQKTFKVISVD